MDFGRCSDGRTWFACLALVLQNHKALVNFGLATSVAPTSDIYTKASFIDTKDSFVLPETFDTFDRDLADLRKGLTDTCTLKKLTVTLGPHGDDELTDFYAGLAENKSIRELNLAFHHGSTRDMAALVAALNKNTTIRQVNLFRIRIDPNSEALLSNVRKDVIFSWPDSRDREIFKD
jgi:hypothetical protein